MAVAAELLRVTVYSWSCTVYIILKKLIICDCTIMLQITGAQ